MILPIRLSKSLYTELNRHIINITPEDAFVGHGWDTGTVLLSHFEPKWDKRTVPVSQKQSES